MDCIMRKRLLAPIDTEEHQTYPIDGYVFAQRFDVGRLFCLSGVDGEGRFLVYCFCSYHLFK